jgi:O-antigen ligase
VAALVSAARRRASSKGARRPAGGGARPRPTRSAGREPIAEPARARGVELARRAGLFAVYALVIVPPFLVSPSAEDAFRLPKLAASETLALLSLLALAAGSIARRSISLLDFARRPPTVFAALLVLAVLPGALWAEHPLHWQRASWSLAIALGCLVGWSAAIPERSLRRAIDLLALPGASLALLAILQAHGVFRPFAFAQNQGARYHLTSLAGSVGDLGAYLVLPALALQVGLARPGGVGGRLLRGVLLALVAYGLFLSETLAALAAVALGSLVLWAILLPLRRLWLAALPLLAIAAVSLVVPGLHHRVSSKLRDLRHEDVDRLLSGRPDAWKVAVEMFREHPWLGVGHGGYRSSFASTKLALAEHGERFWATGRTAHFVNAHNEYLEAIAEWGLWGGAALLGAVIVLLRRLRDLWRSAAPVDRALAVAGCAAFAVLAAASFPLRMALSGYPWVLFAAWIFAEPVPSAADADAAASGRLVVPSRPVVAALLLSLLLALVLHARAVTRWLEASRIVRTTSQVAQLAMRGGAEAARPILQANLRPLHRAAELDPLEVGVPIATGSHYFLLGNGAAAIEEYQRGFAIEPRATLYLNLGRALLLAGRRDEAMTRLDQAVILDPLLEREAAGLAGR